MYLMHHFFIFVTALFMTIMLMPWVMRWALDTGAVDQPGERKVHHQAVPRVGGIAIFIPFLFSVLVFFDLNREVRGILAGALILFFTGLVDDLYGLRPRQKFAGQVAAALVTVVVGHLYVSHLGDLFGQGPVELPFWFAVPFTVFAAVGVVNAINLIDGLDGLAGGVSIIALAAFFVLGLPDRNDTVLALSAALLGGLLGFLKFNSFPARIFMGDTGSLVTGFVLAFLAIALTQKGDGAIMPILPLVILGLPITDTLRVLIGRLSKRRNFLAAGRDHLHHLLMDCGLSHASTVVLIYLSSLFLALAALLLRHHADLLLLIFFILFVLGYYLVIYGTAKNKLPSLRWCDMEGLSRHWRKRVTSSLVEKVLLVLLMVHCFGYFILLLGIKPKLEIWASLILGGGALLLLVVGFAHRKKAFCLILVSVQAVLMTFMLEQNSQVVLFQGISLNIATNLLFVIIASLLALDFFIFKSSDTLSSAPLDVLILGMCLSLAVVSPDLDLAYHLSGFISKGIVILLVFRLVFHKGWRWGRALTQGMFLFTLFLLIHNLWL